MGWERAGGEAVGLFDAVILDHDGTIVDSRDAMVRAYTRWAGEYGASLNEMPKYMGMPSRALAEALVPDAKRWDEAAERIEELEVSDTAGVIPMPGAVDAFRVLPGDAVAVATSCTQPLLDARLNAAGLPHPRVVVTRDQVERGKPAPDSFLLAAKRLGVEPSRALVAEDALAGIAAARAGGFPTLGILSTHTADALRADVHVTDLSQVTWDVSDEGIRVIVHDAR